MSIIRTSHNKENPYVMLNKKALEDSNLSWAAKGLWAYLMSRPDDWTISIPHLSKIYDNYGGGETAIYNYLNELIKHGYCTRRQPKEENGKFGKYEYIISEFQIILPQPGSPDAGPPDAAKLPTTNKGYIQKKETTTKEPAEAVVVDVFLFTDDEREELNNYSAEQIEEAMETTNRECVQKKNESRVKFLFKVLEGLKIKPNNKEKQQHQGNHTKEEKNRIEAKETLKNWMRPKNVKVEFFSNYLEIDCSQGSASGSYQPKILSYNEFGFMEQFENALRKCGCKRKNE